LNLELSDPIDLRALADRFRDLANREKALLDLASASNCFAIASGLERRAERLEKKTHG
jgi:hypothetical protein